MSNFYTKAKRPDGDEFEEVVMIDNYFGANEYGVKFPDGEIFRETKCELHNECEEDKEIGALVDAQKGIELPDLNN